jgi:hypothetical protein
MIVKDEALLTEFRRKLFCELCGRFARNPVHPHHVLGKGHGGGCRMDIRQNLIALGGPWDCNCHGKFHDGNISRVRILVAVANREGMLVGELEEFLWAVQRAPKGTKLEDIYADMP